MPDPVMTLLDIAKLNGTDGLAELVEETIVSVPEITRIMARTIKGTNFKTLVRTSLPSAGFRNANAGAALSASVYENRLFQCFIFNPKWMVDKAVALASEDGPEALVALEADAILKGSWKTLGKQFYYGASSNGDTKGHPGLIDLYDTSLVVDAGGSSANTGSSVWAVKTGPNDVQWLYGQGGDLGLSEVVEAQIADGAGNLYTALIQEILAHVGLKIGSTQCIGRIKKLTEDSGKTLTDDMVFDLFSKFPAGVKPDVLFMSRRSLKQLRQSRTATNATGAPAPMPTEVDGVPIEVTDSILDTEALTL